MKQYIETTFNNQVLRGYHHQVASEDCVLFLHGFTGQKTESHYMFARITRFLEKHNIASLRFDYLGSGESDGEFYEMTWDDLMNQVSHLITVASSYYKRVHVLGFSMGGALAVKQTDPRIQSIIALAPALNMVEITSAIKQQANKTKKGYIDLDSLELSDSFIESLQTNDLYTVPAHKIDICIIQGTTDQAVPKTTVNHILKTNKHATTHYVTNADHTFSSYKYYEFIRDTILQWITNHS